MRAALLGESWWCGALVRLDGNYWRGDFRRSQGLPDEYQLLMLWAVLAHGMGIHNPTSNESVLILFAACISLHSLS